MDNIWGQRFAQRGTAPAWHHKGLLVGDQALTAEGMLNMVGSYDVVLQPMYVQTTLGGDNPITDYSMIMRKPTKDDPCEVQFGAPVHKSYELIGPLQAARIWDRCIVDWDGKPVPVETFGVLKQGQELFISAKIGSFDVKDDEIDSYFVFDNPMYSNNAANLVVTPVRPVCQNTLTLGISKATSHMVINHTEGAAARIATWMLEMYAQATDIMSTAKSDFETMAEKHIQSLDSTRLLEQIYPNPPQPQDNWPAMYGAPMEVFEQRYIEKTEKASIVRQTIMNLFGGDGLGMDTRAVKDTVFGLYNAVAEYEDNRLGTHEARALGVTVGERAAKVRKAYDVLSKFSRS